MEQRSGEIKNVVSGKAVAAEMINACRKRNAATGAARGLYKRKSGKTVGAEKRQPGRFQEPLTTQT
jgi:hypothetical protein